MVVVVLVVVWLRDLEKHQFDADRRRLDDAVTKKLALLADAICFSLALRYTLQLRVTTK